MKQITFYLTLVLTICTISSATQAQDWLSKAKDFLNSNTGSQTTKSLGNAASLSNTEISSGLREALRIGTEKVVSQVGKTDGFNLDPKIHIPLPGVLSRVDSALSGMGMGSLTDDLELRLNRAAEAATPLAKNLFVQSISQMTIDDARNILSGPQDAATQYLRKTMGPSLGQQMGPIVERTLADAGAVKAYDNVMGQYGQIPFMPDVKANLNDYVVEKALDGIFYYVGQEEAAIRANPAARTTDLLKKVFSRQ